MKLFRKKEQSCCGGNDTATQNAPCCCNDKVSVEETKCCSSEDVGLKVLGSGCKKCQSLEESARAAVLELGLELEVIHISDFNEIASYGVMSTPALVLNGKVLSYGKVLNVEEVKELLQKEATQSCCCK